MRSWLLFGAAALGLAVAGQASASTLFFKAHLSGAGEAPLVATTGQGDVVAQLDTGTKVLRYKISYRGLTGPATGAQFSGPAVTGAPTAPVVTVSDPSSPISGEAVLTGAQIADLRKGLWAFNVPTAANPGGEIRGQLNLDHTERTDPPPEPQSPFPVEIPPPRTASLAGR